MTKVHYGKLCRRTKKNEKAYNVQDAQNKFWTPIIRITQLATIVDDLDDHLQLILAQK